MRMRPYSSEMRPLRLDRAIIAFLLAVAARPSGMGAKRIPT
jgi:hypothetical protein